MNRSAHPGKGREFDASSARLLTRAPDRALDE